MEVDGNFYITDVSSIEVDKITTKYAPIVRIQIKSANGALRFSLWGGADLAMPEILMTEKDEREKEPVVVHDLDNDNPGVVK
jgi:hypothetical protein